MSILLQLLGGLLRRTSSSAQDTSQPDPGEALNLRGVAALQAGRPLDAIDLLRQAAEASPNRADIHNNLGTALAAVERHEDALQSFERAFALDPAAVAALVNCGRSLASLRRHEAALETFAHALALRPDFAEAHFNRSLVLADIGRFEEAVQSYDRAIALNPGYADAHYNRGIALGDLNRHAEAQLSYEQAIAANPGHEAARLNLALCRLVQGDFARGWQAYEWRASSPDAGVGRCRPGVPVWTGRESLAGRTILIYAEQGLGDTLQFCRYAKPLAARGARVILEVPPALFGLLGGVEGIAQVLVQGQAVSALDFVCPLPSLPLAFHTLADDIPADIPYVRADAERIALWRGRLGRSERPLIGWAWSGNPMHRNDRNRSVGLSKLLPLAGGWAEHVSVQKELRGEDAALLASRPDIRQFSSQLEDFADTAALIALTDLVVTVDTSVAHLAGALGKPVWILLPFNPDWRWMLGRADSPWYPTARLFRQSARNDWDGALEQLAAALAREFPSAL